MTQTARSSSVYRKVRATIVGLLSRCFQGTSSGPSTSSRLDSNSISSHSCILHFESACWVDGLTRPLLDEYCALLQSVLNESPQTYVELVHAWHSANLPNPAPKTKLPTVLLRALQRMPRASVEFGKLTLQICLRCLLYDPNPLPLAARIVHSSGLKQPLVANQNIQSLFEYASSLVFFDHSAGKERTALALRLMKTFSAEDSYPLAWLMPRGVYRILRALQMEDVVSVACQLRHLSFVGCGEAQLRCRMILRRLLPIAVSVRPEDCFPL
jgi:hypothetical protein